MQGFLTILYIHTMLVHTGTAHCHRQFQLVATMYALWRKKKNTNAHPHPTKKSLSRTMMQNENKYSSPTQKRLPIPPLITALVAASQILGSGHSLSAYDLKLVFGIMGLL